MTIETTNLNPETETPTPTIIDKVSDYSLDEVKDLHSLHTKIRNIPTRNIPPISFVEEVFSFLNKYLEKDLTFKYSGFSEDEDLMASVISPLLDLDGFLKLNQEQRDLFHRGKSILEKLIFDNECIEYDDVIKNDPKVIDKLLSSTQSNLHSVENEIALTSEHNNVIEKNKRLNKTYQKEFVDSFAILPIREKTNLCRQISSGSAFQRFIYCIIEEIRKTAFNLLIFPMNYYYNAYSASCILRESLLEYEKKRKTKQEISLLNGVIGSFSFDYDILRLHKDILYLSSLRTYSFVCSSPIAQILSQFIGMDVPESLILTHNEMKHNEIGIIHQMKAIGINKKRLELISIIKEPGFRGYFIKTDLESNFLYGFTDMEKERTKFSNSYELYSNSKLFSQEETILNRRAFSLELE